MTISCSGNGNPVVVLESGLGRGDELLGKCNQGN